MQIAANTVATLNYVLAGDDGNILDENTDSSFVYLHGASNIIPGLENALNGKLVGDKFSVKIEPEDGYGVHDDNLVQTVARTMFPEDTVLEVDSEFHAEAEDGEEIIITVTEIQDDNITIDGNHPLAGLVLNFDVEVMAVREASDEELSHGHAHD